MRDWRGAKVMAAAAAMVVGAVLMLALVSGQAADPLRNYELTPNAPSGYGESITPDDDEDLERVTRGVYVGAGGDLTAILAKNGTSLVFSNVPDGAILPLRVKRILATGTTASGIVGLY